jgi:hypothetical protein
MFMCENVPVPELGWYFAVKVVLPGVRPVTKTVALASAPSGSTGGRHGGAAAVDEATRLQAEIQLGEATDEGANGQAQTSATTVEPIPVAPAATPDESIVLSVADAARPLLDRGRGQTGPWARSTRERYDRVVRQHFERSADGTLTIGAYLLPDLTADVVADWSAGLGQDDREHRLADATVRVPVRGPARLAERQSGRSARTAPLAARPGGRARRR